MRRFLLLLLAVFVTASTTVSAASYRGYGNGKYNIAGTMKVEVRDGDSVLVYDVVVTGFVPDSVTIAALRRFECVVDAGNAISLGDSRHLKYRFKGSISPNSKPKYHNPWGDVAARGMVGEDTISVYGRLYLRPYYCGVNFSIIGWGYGEGRLPSAETRHSPLYAGEIGFMFFAPRAEIFAQISGLSNCAGGGPWSFSHSEHTPIGLRILPFGRTGFYPTISASVQNSAVTVRRHEAELHGEQWGGQFGLRIETPSERLYYDYSTALGGYYRTGIMFKTNSGGLVNLGTRYEYIRLDGVDMFRVQLQLEISGLMDGDSESLERYSPRPWWHKGLALGAAVPLFPIYGIFKLLGLDQPPNHH